MSQTIKTYLDLMDTQREAVFSLLDEITDAQLWQRPAPGEWSIGEILDHNYLLMASSYPIVKFMWNGLGWYGRWQRSRPYKAEIEDLYRSPKFPQWVGFMWTPRFNPRKPVSLEKLKSEVRNLHADIRRFYEGKDEDVLGNLYLFDPLFGWCNLIVTLRIGIYHDQLHFDDVVKQAAAFK
ncbi:MAG: DinB family protein [Anaerolineales bacterium]|nr:DinB family protein [Anaerolineales bacterium]